MRVLVVSAMFPPNILGGAEISAFNLSRWLRDQGHEVAVLTAANGYDDQLDGEMVDGLRIWRRRMPRPYPITLQGRVKRKYLKPLWHLQDHFDPRNAAIVADVLDRFKPDFCNVHYLTGIGHNALKAIGVRDIPIMYVMPDLALSCLKLKMFEKGKTCERQCALCVVSSRVKGRGVRACRRIGFSSPSYANLERNARFQPAIGRLRAHILNANRYPEPTAPRRASDVVRLIYVGRLETEKGVRTLLEAAQALSRTQSFELSIVGSGSQEPEFKAAFGHHPWLTFHGHVSLQAAIDHIAQSDVLCIPSVWLENSPGVVIQALGLGVPVVGSDVGGIPELVKDGETGLLVPPDDVAQWTAALSRIIADKPLRVALQQSAVAQAWRFSQDHVGKQYVAFMEQIATA
jgi:glycosyltransferase involved in cell wall biosynthesis